MPYVWTALVLVAALCLLDLIVSFAIIRRLREQRTEAGSAPESGVLPPGSAIEHAPGLTTAGRTVVGLFLTECAPCKAVLPSFVEYARDSDLPVVAVVTGDPDRAGSLVAALEPVADVIVDGPAGPVAKAFRAESFPLMYVLDDGRVTAGGRTPSALPAAVPA